MSIHAIQRSEPSDIAIKPQKSAFRKLYDKISSIFSRIFACFCWPKKSEPINPDRVRIQHATTILLTKKPPAPAPASPKEEEVKEALSGNLSRHLLNRVKPVRHTDNPMKDEALNLGDEVMDALSKEVMENGVLPYVPQIVNGTQTLNKTLNDSLGWLDDLQKKFSDSIMPNLSKNLTKEEKEDPFLILFDVINIIILIRSFDPDFDEKNLKPIVQKYILDHKMIDSLLPKEAMQLFNPILDWVFESYETNTITPFETFFEKNHKNYGLDKEYFNENRPQIIQKALAKISEKIFGLAHDAFKKDLDQLTDPVTLIQTLDELINVNAHQAAEKVIERVLDLAKNIDAADLVCHNLPQLTDQLSGKEHPIGKDEIKNQGVDFIDLLFPIITDDNGKQTRSISLLWKEKHIPEALKKMPVPSVEGILCKLTNSEELPAAGKRALNKLEANAQMRLARLAQSSLNPIASSAIEKVVEIMKDPEFIDELIGDTVIPKAIEKIVAIFAKQVLSTNLDEEFIDQLRQIARAPSMEALRESDTLNNFIMKWHGLMNDPKIGFDAFNSQKGEEYDAAKFTQLVMPIIEELRERLQTSPELYGKKVREIVHEYMNPPSAQPIHDKERTAAYSAFIKKMLEEGNVFDGKWFASTLQSQIGQNADIISELVIESIPTTRELLEIALGSLREMWTTEIHGEKHIDMNKVLKRIPSQETINEQAIMDDPTLNDGQKIAQLQELKLKVKQEKFLKLTKKISQVSALIADFSSQKTYHYLAENGNKVLGGHWYNAFGLGAKAAPGMAYHAVKSYLTPDTLNKSIKKVYENLFSGEEKNRQIVASFFRTLITDLSR